MSKPGAFIPPPHFEEVPWKAGLPKKKELWLVQLPLSVDTESLSGVTVKLRDAEGVIGSLRTDDGTSLRVLDDGEMMAHQHFAIDPGATAGKQVRRIARRITLATAPPEPFGSGAAGSSGAQGGGGGDGGDADDGGKKKKKKKKDKGEQKDEEVGSGLAGAGGGKESKKRKDRDSEGGGAGDAGGRHEEGEEKERKKKSKKSKKDKE